MFFYMHPSDGLTQEIDTAIRPGNNIEKERIRVKKIPLLFCVLVVITQISSAQTVWNSAKGTVTFTKQSNADWTQAANQDRISDSVWITRANNQSLFNIRKESAYVTNSPIGTLWAFGTTDSFATREYKSFVSLSGGNPQALIGKNLVLKLIAENIYLDFKLLSYGGSNSGGGFSYIRAAQVLSAVSGVSSPVTAFELRQNYPNPFNPATTIGFTLQNTGLTTLKIYDIVGREVATLVNNELLEAGVYHQKQFDAGNLASGVYFIRLSSGDMTQIRRIMLLK
jgi:hypothetical protein